MGAQKPQREIRKIIETGLAPSVRGCRLALMMIGKKGKEMLTQEQKKAICEDYKDRSKTVNEIANKYGVSRGDVAHIAVEMGAEPRSTKKYGAKHKKQGERVRICPKCHKAIDVKGARFCCFCGSDIRSDKECLIERIENAIPNILHLPVNMRDEMQILFVDIVKELEGGHNDKRL